MTADLAAKHIGTLNMQFETGRSKAAPGLDSVESMVKAWHIDENGEQVRKKVVRFHPEVLVRAVPAVGRCRKTPPRGSGGARATTWKVPDRGNDIGDDIDAIVMEQNKDKGASMAATRKCTCRVRGIPIKSEGTRWADLESDEQCITCAEMWGKPSPAATTVLKKTARQKFGFKQGADDESVERPVDSLENNDEDGDHGTGWIEVESESFGRDYPLGIEPFFNCARKGSFCYSDVNIQLPIDGQYRAREPIHEWPSGGILEADRPVPTLNWRSNSVSRMNECIHEEYADSKRCSHRRRSVSGCMIRGRGCMRVALMRCIHVGVCMCVYVHACMCILFLFVYRLGQICLAAIWLKH